MSLKKAASTERNSMKTTNLRKAAPRKGNLMRAANHGRVAQIEENPVKATKVTMMRRVFRSTTPTRNLLLLHKQGLQPRHHLLQLFISQ